MAGQVAPTTIVPSGVRARRVHRRPWRVRRCAPAATDRLAPKRCASLSAALQRPRQDAEIVYGEVSWVLSLQGNCSPAFLQDTANLVVQFLAQFSIELV